jgi:NADPH2:quinone reductase
MRAIQVHGFGGTDQLVYQDAPVPEPGPGEVRVKVVATGLNFVEIYQRRGLYQKALPFIPGEEFSGTVDALGEGVSDFKLGERVVTANGSGGYAQYALAPAWRLMLVPQGISFQQAAAVLLQGMTAHYLALTTYPLQESETALLHAAASGVGQILVQIAKMRGVKVIGTVSTEEKASIARSLGADEVINYTQEDFESAVMRITNNRGVDVVYDGVGKTTFLKGLNCLKKRGMMVLYGQSSGPAESIDPQLLNRKGSLYLTRPMLRDYLLTRQEIELRANALFDWIASGALKVAIDRTFPLEEAAAAHQYMEGRKTKGKVLLMP